MELAAGTREPYLVTQVVPPRDAFPNNGHLPLLAMLQAVRPAAGNPEVFEGLFAANGWGGSWRDGVYAVHHYHSTAHEVLGIYGGAATIQFGGPHGLALEVTAGDVVVIPAGVAHKRLSATPDFAVVGAYPRGQHPDMGYGKLGELGAATARVAAVPRPQADPVFGPTGPLRQHWREAQT